MAKNLAFPGLQPLDTEAYRRKSLWQETCIATGMFDPVSAHLEHYMNLLSTRQKLVASNIANLDTPGYKTRDIDFHFEFMSKMDAPQSERDEPTILEAGGQIVKNDGNDVSLDREMRMLSENAIRFSIASTLLKGQMSSLRTAIQEGGK